MLAANLVEDLTRRAGAAVRNIVQTLADAFFRVCAGGNIEQPLVGFPVTLILPRSAGDLTMIRSSTANSRAVRAGYPRERRGGKP